MSNCIEEILREKTLEIESLNNLATIAINRLHDSRKDFLSFIKDYIESIQKTLDISFSAETIHTLLAYNDTKTVSAITNDLVQLKKSFGPFILIELKNYGPASNFFVAIYCHHRARSLCEELISKFSFSEEFDKICTISITTI